MKIILEHKREGFITNLKTEELSIYQEAIRRCDDFALVICDKAFDNLGRIIPQHYSVRKIRTSNKDMAIFWRTICQLKEEQIPIENELETEIIF